MGQLIFPVTKKEAEKQGIRYSSETNRNAVFPSTLRSLREEAGVSQATLAAKLGISKSTLGLYESGDTLPDAKTLYDMASFFKVSADYILNLSTVRSTNVDEKGVCQYTGLSSEAVAAISHDMKHKKSRSQAEIIDYLIREFYLSFMSVNLWRQIKDSALSEAALKGNMDDLVSERKKFNKWRFLAICERMYDELVDLLAPLLKEAVEEELRQDLEQMQRDAERNLRRIQELRKRKS